VRIAKTGAPGAQRDYGTGGLQGQPLLPMKLLSYLHLVVAQAFYRWAMREISPTHPDVPRIMMRQKELSDRASRLFA
jgi:hypothetical protein